MEGGLAYPPGCWLAAGRSAGRRTHQPPTLALCWLFSSATPATDSSATGSDSPSNSSTRQQLESCSLLLLYPAVSAAFVLRNVRGRLLAATTLTLFTSSCSAKKGFLERYPFFLRLTLVVFAVHRSPSQVALDFRQPRGRRSHGNHMRRIRRQQGKKTKDLSDSDRI